MPSYYDDNFGHWDMDDDPEETLEFYNKCQEESVEKKCKGCDKTVKILPSYAYCNSCADKMERGIDI